MRAADSRDLGDWQPPTELARLLDAAATAEEEEDGGVADAARWWNEAVASPHFRTVPSGARYRVLSFAGRASQRLYSATGAPEALARAIDHFLAALDHAPAGSSHHLAASVNLADAFAATGSAAEWEKGVIRLRTAVDGAPVGRPLRAHALEVLVRLLFSRPDRGSPGEDAARRVRALTDLLEERPDAEPALRARLFEMLAQAWMGCAREELSTGAEDSLRQAAAAYLHGAEALAGAHSGGGGEAAARLRALAEDVDRLREQHTAALREYTVSHTEALDEIAAEPDPYVRVVRLRALLGADAASDSGDDGAGEDVLVARALIAHALGREPAATADDIANAVAAVETAWEEADGGAATVRAVTFREETVRAVRAILADLRGRQGPQGPQGSQVAGVGSAGSVGSVGSVGLAGSDGSVGSVGQVRDDDDPERQIATLHAAIERLDSRADAHAWGEAQHNLGRAYAERHYRGARADNLRLAVHHFVQCLTVHTRDRDPVDWAITRAALAGALGMLADLGAASDDDMRQCVRGYADAADVFQAYGRITDWARARVNAGLAALDGQRDHVRAAACFRDVLRYLDGPPVLGTSVGEGADDTHVLLRAWCASGLGQVALLEIAARIEVNGADGADGTEGTSRADRADGASEADRADEASGADGADGVDAERHHETALALFGQLPGRDREWTATAAQLFTFLCWRDLGEGADPAGARCERIVDLGMRTLDRMERYGLTAHAAPHALQLAGTLVWAGRGGEAASVALRGLALVELSHRASLTRGTRRSGLVGVDRLVETAARALGAEDRLREAVLAIERGRARELGERLALERADLGRLAEADPEAHREFVTAAREAEANAATGQGGARLAPDAANEQSGDGEAASHATELHRAEAATRRLSAAVERVREVPGHAAFLRPPDAETLRAAAEPGRPLIYLLPTDNGTLVFLVRGREDAEPTVQLFTAPSVNRAEADRLAEVYLAAAHRPDVGFQDFQEVLRHCLRFLSERLIGPLRRVLASTGDPDHPDAGYVLIPCGLLAVFPLHAVPDDQEPERCLLSDLDIAFAPSAQVYAASRSALGASGHAPKEGAGRFAGVGDPTGDLPFAGVELAAVGRLVDAGAADEMKGAGAADQMKGAGAADLPNGAGAAHLLLGERATAGAVREAVRGADLVHLACHTAFNPDDPLESALILADHTRLTLGELLDSRLLRGTRLVVAAGCHTGTGESVLPEESLSLASGLLQAGAATVVASLWKVNDLAGALLMTRFHEERLAALGRRPGVGEAPGTGVGVGVGVGVDVGVGVGVDVRSGLGSVMGAGSGPAEWLRRAQLWLRGANVGALARHCARLDAYGGEDAGLDPLARFGAACAREPDQERRPFADPAYWAPFIVVGA